MRRRSRAAQTIKNKSTPAMGLAIGVILTSAGLLFLIPSLGAGGVYWTLLSLIWTISCAIRLFRSMDDEPEDPPRPPPLREPDPIPEEEETDPVVLRLRDLQELYVGRVLSREEYELAVREITEAAEQPGPLHDETKKGME